MLRLAVWRCKGRWVAAAFGYWLAVEIEAEDSTCCVGKLDGLVD